MKKNLLIISPSFLQGEGPVKKIHCLFGKKIFALAIVFFISSGFLKSSAQIINDNGQQHGVAYNGGFQDLVIPNNPLITKIRFSLSGADGGAAILRMGQNVLIGFVEAFRFSSGGGNGAVVNGTFRVGTGAGKIPHGSTVRFIIGQKGVTGVNNISVLPHGGTGSDYGGGGGGTAILFRPPGATVWTLLGVAGGGGGAYQGVQSGIPIGLGDEGGAGEESVNGADGGSFILDYGEGGVNQNGGGTTVKVPLIESPAAAGGGGRLTDGSDIEFDFGGGGAGISGGSEVGGHGGFRDASSIFSWILEIRNGGFGYGGGGAGAGTGGGGGGYAGGGAGGLLHGGGGGGSYLNGIRETGNVSGGGSDTEPDDGFAQYQVTLNQPPVAICKNVTLYLSATGTASLVVGDVNNGSNDPDGTPITYSLSKNNFTCADIGPNNVTLTVRDADGATSTCVAVVTVVDNINPVITCPADITVSCAADVPAVNTASVVATDNCTVTVSHVSDVITNQTCDNRFTLTRTYSASDISGNSASCVQVITVNDDTPPQITGLSASPAILWPPNHKMRNVTVSYDINDNCTTPTTTISVSSNEPVNGTGDGDTAPDWEIIDNHHIRLRAERAGNGTGRIYTITITANDGCNPTVIATTEVVVPHNNNSQNAVNNILVQGTPVSNTPLTTEANKEVLEEIGADKLELNAYPNPTTKLFTLLVRTNDTKQKIIMQVVDQYGRIVETRNNVIAGSVIQLGEMYKSGAYYVRIMQGKEHRVIKLIKLSD